MNRARALPLLKLALAALERAVPNVDLARGVLRDVVGGGHAQGEAQSKALGDVDAGTGKVQKRHAVTIKRAAELLSMCPKTVRNKIARGEIPVIGAGRATRVLMPDALHALTHQGTTARRKPAESEDPIAEEAVAFVRNRTRLRAVAGGEGHEISRARRTPR